jgi:hypothetical protein
LKHFFQFQMYNLLFVQYTKKKFNRQGYYNFIYYFLFLNLYKMKRGNLPDDNEIEINLDRETYTPGQTV